MLRSLLEPSQVRRSARDVRYGSPVSFQRAMTRRVVLVAEHADARPWTSPRRAPPRGVERDPAGAEHAQQWPCENTADVAVGGGELGDHAVGARADVGGALAAGAAVAPQVPVRALRRGSARVVRPS